MVNTRKSLVLAVLAGVFASGLAYAITPVGGDNVVAGRGWDMGTCRIPTGESNTVPIYFVDGEIINMPVHINRQNDSPDARDIYISGNPVFTYTVEMGESRYTADGNDKYADIMQCFTGGINFDVPDSEISDEAAVQNVIDQYRDSTLTAYRFEPNLTGLPNQTPFDSSHSSYKSSAVQLEFFVQGGVGMVRITNNCAVRLMDPGIYDYNIVTGSSPATFHPYKIYGYHYRPNGAANQITVPITDTYVSESQGGQIFVDGHVVIGGDSNASMPDPNQVVKGKITVVATGNIWVADSIRVDGDHDVNDMPTSDNPNFLGLISQGVIKIVDPGLLPTSPATVVGYTYQPIANSRSGYTGRWLPHNTVVEAALTTGGGGWGAENVGNGNGRKVYSPPMDDLYVHGAIAEVLRGIVGLVSANGYMKHYSYDRRWNPVPAGCSDIIPGDLNGDCVVDLQDIATMALHWLQNNLSGDEPPVCTSPIQGDINNDCMVDFVDLAIIAEYRTAD